MDVRVLTAESVRHPDVSALPHVVDGDGLVWVDVPSCDTAALETLRSTFGFHPRALEDCARRNPVPKLHVYPDHVFFVLHSSEPGMGGHVHHIELDLFVGEHFLVTVHGPVGTAVNQAVALGETRAVAQRIEDGRLRPGSPHELSYLVVNRLTAKLEEHLRTLTTEVWRLEREVTSGHFGDAEQFLEEMFRARHGLLTINTMATLNHEVYGRMATLEVFGHSGREFFVADLADQFRRVAAMADSQRAYLQGVIEFYQTRTSTKMTIAAERLSVIAAVTLPITAVSSVVGMNVIVNDHTEWGALWLLLGVMGIMSAMLLAWARRKGWW
jgi:Mg2+ and Co2+ transporter CorA